MKKITTFFILVLVHFGSMAQISAWQFGVPASLGNEVTYNATTTAPNSTMSVLSRGAGISAASLARAFSATNFAASGTKANALATDQYFSFSLTANPGFQLSLSTLDVKLRRSGTGPSTYVWRYSNDGVNFFDIGVDMPFTSTNTEGEVQPQIDLSSIPALQNVLSGTTITFRLYAWGATAVGGTFAIGRTPTGLTNNCLAIGGTVTVPCVPFPVSIASNPVSNTICEGSSTILTASGGISYVWNPGNIAGNPVTLTPATTTTYTVIASDANNCTSTSSVTITVNSTPPPTNVTATPNSFCGVGGPANVNAISAGNIINWYTVPSGGISLGNSASGANFAVTPAATTTYYAEANPVVVGPPISQTFSFTGGTQTFTVPAGVSTVTIEAWGAQGGTNALGVVGGLGGYATGALAVTPGDILTIEVGGSGIAPVAVNSLTGGYNGGGSGGITSAANVNPRGGGGGGSSDVRHLGVALANRVIVAGGGGGAAGNRVATIGRGTGGGGGGGYFGGGGGAGWPSASVVLPTGGSQLAGGNGGTSTFVLAGNAGGAGSLGIGGDGGLEASSNQAGSQTGSTGGIGGGLNGSNGIYGGNFSGQSGAGGSSYTGGVAGGSTTAGIRTGNGQVILTYNSVITGCPSFIRTPVTITVNPLPTFSTVTPTDVLCNGAANGQIVVSSAAPGAVYTINPVATQAPAGTFTGLAPNIYTVTLTDGAGCSTTTAVTIAQPAILTATASSSAVCAGSLSTLSGSETGGTPTYTYQWISGYNTTTVTINPSKDNTIYQETQTNSNGIGPNMVAGNNGFGFAGRALMAFDIVAALPANAVVNSASLQLNCSQANPGSGAQVQSLHSLLQNWGEGTSVAVGAGAGAPATLNDATWLKSFFPGTDWITAGGSFNVASSASTTVNAIGFYTWTAPQMVADVQSWLNNPAANFGWLLKGTESGATQAKRFDSKENLTVANRPQLTINYSTPIIAGNTAILNNMAAGTYTLVVTDANGCTATSVTTVTVNPLPTVTASASPSAICPGGSSVLTGGGALTYTWDPGALVGGPTVTPAATTTYSVVGTDGNGCTGTATVDVTVNATPVVTASASPATICEGSSSVLTGGGAATYAWNPGALVGSPTVTPIVTTTYSVTGTDANGCTGTTTVDVTVNPAPVMTATATPATTCNQTVVTPSASGAATIAWTGGVTNNVPFIANATTTYTVTGTDGIGCTGSTTVLVTVNPMSGILAPATTNQTQDHGDDFNVNYYDGSCDLIATVDDGAGGNILGLTTSTVTVDPGFGVHNGQPFVRRWYQITPTNNGSADVILYINQSDFDNYNLGVALPYLPLPTTGNNADPNIPNIRITKNSDAGLGNSCCDYTNGKLEWNVLGIEFQYTKLQSI
ncbi:MAG: hypothetical protein IPJ31_16480 [Bacteroidetes bacterium]|nr:hypothetical protein [Bacteroidota bacterium]